VLLNHQAMAIVCVPDIVVVKAIHVSLELATIHVDVGDEQKRYVKYTIHATNV